ncbi:hypothetical protein ACQP2U_43250 (plasmid) [Nocardia sp. CA-084685]|uniref:hypothetical protein n=1 Tax=Nocardia sp. CA-084685 TaxID=3239970 RepID=UPI003D978CF4
MSEPDRLRDIGDLAATGTAAWKSFLEYENDGAAAESLKVWQENAARINTARREAERRAIDAGIVWRHIDQARTAGFLCPDWRHIRRQPDLIAAMRTALVGVVVADAQQLGVMAIVDAVRTLTVRSNAASDEPNPVGAQQYRQNMESLLIKVNSLGALLELTESEHASIANAEIQARKQWLDINGVVPNDDIEARWNAFARPEIAEDADGLASTLLDGDPFLPRPDALIEHASDALADRAYDDGVEAAGAVDALAAQPAAVTATAAEISAIVAAHDSDSLPVITTAGLNWNLRTDAAPVTDAHLAPESHAGPDMPGLGP